MVLVYGIQKWYIDLNFIEGFQNIIFISFLLDYTNPFGKGGEETLVDIGTLKINLGTKKPLMVKLTLIMARL